MKISEKDRLLNDLLRDESYLAFRASLFGGLLADLPRNRASGTRRKLLALAACLPIAFVIFLFMTARIKPSVQRISTVNVVRTVSLLPDRIVTTVPGHTESATMFRKVMFVTTSHSEIEIVRSAAAPTETLSDEQLLDLFKGRPVALVFVAPNERRLVLLDEEQKR